MRRMRVMIRWEARAPGGERVGSEEGMEAWAVRAGRRRWVGVRGRNLKVRWGEVGGVGVRRGVGIGGGVRTRALEGVGWRVEEEA